MQRLRWIALIVVALIAGSLAPAPVSAEEPAYEMYFPVVGDNHYSDTWGAPRSGGRTHEGIDIMSAKMVPVIAVADATVGWMLDEIGGNCCAMALTHDDGWSSWYIHLNNDTEGTDDGLGFGFAEGIESGAHVRAGQLIGWVGDSGNAEACNCPHLHFELHQPDGVKVNPFPHLIAATPLEAPLPKYFTPPFMDDDGSVHEDNILFIHERGITFGCESDRYCPSDPVSREHMAAFLQRALGLPGSETEHFADIGESPFSSAINAIADAGVTSGCEPGAFCPADTVTRGQMASFISRAFAIPNTEIDFFVDDENSTHEDAINALAAVGITAGCSSDGTFCINDLVTRAQMASFIARAITWVEAQPSE